ncbi:TRAF2 and NCK-interacting protein kinase [Elysia marginata]|uniref:non-specific serine/threonine protein kinase n=1 Tax=Elysia marginata TaxID=1093978 RepID=A0AAV4G1C1_9GAST|nr:TRAF2 and NCK-interacting protein kinase [Elysia marginata]
MPNVPSRHIRERALSIDRGMFGGGRPDIPHSSVSIDAPSTTKLPPMIKLNKSEPVIHAEPERDRRSAAAAGAVDRRAGGDHVSRDKERGHHGHHGQQAKLPSSSSSGGVMSQLQHVHRTSSNSSTSSAPGAVASSQSPRHSGVMPDLVPPHTPPQSRSPPTPQRPQDKMSSEEYRRAVLQPAMKHQRSFSAFGFGAAMNDAGQAGSTIGSVSSGSSGTVQGRHNSAASSGNSRRGSQINVNVAPMQTTEGVSDTPEIRKYKKRFGSDILCAALWGVNLLIGTESGLMLLDRSGQGKVYTLISRRRFQQMEVLEGQNILVTISGKKSKIRVYYLSWLKSKILKNDTSFPELKHKPQLVDLTVEEGQRLKVIYGSSMGFHAIDLDSSSVFDLYIPSHNHGPITPHTIVILPNTNGLQLLLCYDNEGVYVDSTGKITKNVVLQWGELPTSVAYISTGQIMGWGNKAIEIRSAETGHLDGVFMHKKAQKLKFLCERNDKVFFSSVRSGSSCQIYFMTLSKPGLANW